MVSRRNFVKSVGAALPLVAASAQFAGASEQNTAPYPKGPVITKISIFRSSGSFYRFIGMNAYDKAPKGINSTGRHFTIELSDGTVGVGTTGYSTIDEAVISKIKSLLGKDPFTFYTWQNDKIAGVAPAMQAFYFDSKYAWIESGVLDVIGKLQNQPVWKLLGGNVREGIDPYDGTLYFEDIAQNKDASVIGEIGKRIKNDGYRAIKIKLGRPDKWMPGEAGLHRDIEAFISLREAVGQNFQLMADANNGYQNKFDWAVKLMSACAPYNMYFMEELFPDDAGAYRKLREALLKENFFIPIGEGENIRELEKFDEYCQAGVYNYIQPDMATSGVSNILLTARNAEKYPHVKLIPHVWQSQFGLIMSLHVSKVQRNIPYVEDSRYVEHAFIPLGYSFTNGQWFLSEKPGWGIGLAPDYKQFVLEPEIVIS
jgi:L-alanine-DL-glutamate epimerase-like enolase superfamily enzyme